MISEAIGIAAQLDAAGVGISHHFGGGVYLKETDIPAGAELTQHVHTHDHLSYLVSGRVLLEIDGIASAINAPASILMKAGALHAVHALTDAVWLCVWATSCTDADHIDDVLTGHP